MDLTIKKKDWMGRISYIFSVVFICVSFLWLWVHGTHLNRAREWLEMGGFFMPSQPHFFSLDFASYAQQQQERKTNRRSFFFFHFLKDEHFKKMLRQPHFISFCSMSFFSCAFDIITWAIYETRNLTHTHSNRQKRRTGIEVRFSIFIWYSCAKKKISLNKILFKWFVRTFSHWYILCPSNASPHIFLRCTWEKPRNQNSNLITSISVSFTLYRYLRWIGFL